MNVKIKKLLLQSFVQKENLKQLLPALVVNIIIVHPWAKALRTTTPPG
jgi:hypothetical protein